ncbi:methionine ABC transporter ATP-binding protein [Aerococcus tenax]|uniref:methionine ABC transporter ATP-binding protein n=1 Tax=Aerococcus tenax TaxID=3078812 RepID=UPI0018A7B1A2|nr:ATP-binding cassette domain-containing protein [Aerococcus tenax]
MTRKVFELTDVSKTFKSEREEFTALKDISLSINEGEIFGIIGMSGAGKSTLVRTLNRLEDVSSGSVKFYGQDLSTLKFKELRKIRHSISMIFQSFNLLQQRTVLQNVEQPLRIIGANKYERQKKAEEMLGIVGIYDKKDTYPARLSGGQRQRVAIARALASNPKVLLCDEPTSALDPKVTEGILDLLKKINKDRKLTIVIITHEMAVVEKICDRVAIIDQGKVVEIGDVNKVFQSKAAKELIFSSNSFAPSNPNGQLIRLILDGLSASESFIYDLIDKTRAKINILSSNIQSVEGKKFGQMVVEIPPDNNSQVNVIKYLKEKGIRVLEVGTE